jgi:hypothetical protein
MEKSSDSDALVIQSMTDDEKSPAMSPFRDSPVKGGSDMIAEQINEGKDNEETELADASPLDDAASKEEQTRASSAGAATKGVGSASEEKGVEAAEGVEMTVPLTSMRMDPVSPVPPTPQYETLQLAPSSPRAGLERVTSAVYAEENVVETISDTEIKQLWEEEQQKQRAAQKKRRTSSAGHSRESDEDFDIGARGWKPHISSKQVAKEVAELLPRTKEMIQKGVQHIDKIYQDMIPFDIHLGRFKLPLEHEDSPALVGALDHYGPSISFYFKLLKAYGLLFLVMSIITFPTLVMFPAIKEVDHRTRTYNDFVNPKNQMSQTTIKAMHMPIPSCRQEDEGSVIELECPTNFVMKSVISYYGQNYGSCACPYEFQQDATGLCPGTIDATRTCDGGPCFYGETRYKYPCCSDTAAKTSGDEGDMDFLALEPILTSGEVCNSQTAPYIARGMCEGKSYCMIPVNFTNTIGIPVKRQKRAKMPNNYCRKIENDICETELGYRGDFSGCDPDVSLGLIFEAICESEVLEIAGYEHDPLTVAEWLSTLNYIAITLFILGALYVQFEMRYEVEQSDQNQCTAADYTVLCSTLPKGCETRDDMRARLTEHFEKFIDPDPDNPAPIIADINFSNSDYNYMQEATMRAKAAFEVDRLVSKFYAAMDLNQFDEIPELKNKLKMNMKIALLRYELANDKCNDLHKRAERSAHDAYITFGTEKAVSQAIMEFENLGGLTGCLVPKEKLLDGRAVLIRRAPEPEDVIWENAGRPLWKQFGMVVLTTLITIAILAISYASIYEVYYLSQTFQEDSVVAKDGSTYNVLISKNQTLMDMQGTNTITYEKVLFDLYPAFYGLQNTTYGSREYLFTYCQQVLASEDSDTFYEYTFTNPNTGDEETLCGDILSGSYLYSAVSTASSFVVVMVNVIIQVLLRGLAGLEKLSTKTREVMSLAMKLFVAQYINMALLALIINGNLSVVRGGEVKLGTSGVIEFGFFTGEIPDYDSDWYFFVGSSLMFTMIIFSLGRIPGPIFQFAKKLNARIWDRRWTFGNWHVTRKQLLSEVVDLYTGPRIRMEEKYASLLVLIYVCMTYSATMPLMYPIIVVNILIMYHSEKYFILRWHKAPEILGPELPNLVSFLVVVAAVIHLLMAFWMWGFRSFYDPDLPSSREEVTVDGKEYLLLFHSFDNGADWLYRLYGPVTIFGFILFCGLYTYLFVFYTEEYLFEFAGINNFFKLISRSIKKCCGYSLVQAEADIEGNPDYFDAIPMETLVKRLARGRLRKDVLAQYKTTLSIRKAMEKKSTSMIMKSGRDEGFSASADIDMEEAEVVVDSDDVEMAAPVRKFGASANSASANNASGKSLNPSEEEAGPGQLVRSSARLNLVKRIKNDFKRHMRRIKTQGERVMNGCESYNMVVQETYGEMYGLTSDHMRRVRPTDSVVAAVDMAGPPEDRPELADLLAECAPRRDAHGKIRLEELATLLPFFARCCVGRGSAASDD